MISSAPKSPDPKETAAAQTGTNVSTAIANATLGNVNQKTPWGSLTYNQTGSKFINDANGTKQWYNPATGEYRSTQPTTSVATPASTGGNATGPRMFDEVTGQWQTSDRKPVNPGTQAGTQVTPDAGWQEVTGYNIPQYEAVTELTPEQQAILGQQNVAGLNLATLAATQSGKLNDILGRTLDLSGAPTAGTAGQYQNLATSFGDAGPITNSIAGAGDIQRSLGDAGDITNSYNTDFSADRQRVEDALMARLQPSLDKNRSSQAAQLAAQGIKLGSQAYGASQDDISRAENDARYGAILNAGQEQSRLVGLEANRAAFQNAAQAQKYGQLLNTGQFANSAQAQQYGQNANDAQFANSAQAQNYGQLLDRANFGNSATQGNNAISTQKFNEQNALRNQWLTEQYAQRNQPINEISSLLAGAQVQSPNFVNTNMPSIPTTDVAGITQQDYANRMGAYQQNQASIGGLLGGLGSLFSLSDERAKKDIKPVGKLLDKTNVYEYRYKGQGASSPKSVGVLAQEVEKKYPDVVATGRDGLKRVAYGRLMQKMAA